MPEHSKDKGVASKMKVIGLKKVPKMSTIPLSFAALSYFFAKFKRTTIWSLYPQGLKRQFVGFIQADLQAISVPWKSYVFVPKA